MTPRFATILAIAALAAATVACVAGEPLSTFDFPAFREPPVEARPWVRWWWPGTDVDDGELRREVGVLAGAFFGGAEIQAMGAALPKDVPAEALARRRTAHTPAFFAHVVAALEEAQARGLAIDLTLGSGWPPGGTHVAAGESMQTLLFAERRVEGPGPTTLELSVPDKPPFYTVAEASGSLGEAMSRWMPEHARLVAVLAARVAGGERTEDLFDLDDQVLLDASSVLVLTDRVAADGKLEWDAPEGTWQVVAAFSQPDGMFPLFNAEPEPGYVVDHFDAAKVAATVERFAGAGTGLEPHYGKALRGFFVDSLELKVERFFAADFLAEFAGRRGYDAVPWLPAVFLPGADNNLFDGLGIATAAPFGFDARDGRLQHDWQATASELFLERFQDTVRTWAEARGMGLRMQGYGANVDVLRAAGGATIPEAEQLYAGGSDLFLKAVSSGAHLYGRNVVAAESIVWMLRDHLTTPTVIVAAVNKLLAAGINHVVYHGFPYRRMEGAGEPGWHPFSSPWGGTSTYSSHVSETSPFWQDMEAVNRYVARCQVAMRAGAPEADVLVYYPFLGFPASLVRAEGIDEPLFLGRMDGDDAAATSPLLELVAGFFGPPDPGGHTGWLVRAARHLEELHGQGWSWDFVNEHSLLGASVANGRIAIRDRSYGAVVLYDTPEMSPALAERLADLATAGAAIALVGDAPKRQPGHADMDAGDARVRDAMGEVLMGRRTRVDPTSATAWSLLLEGAGAEPGIATGAASPWLRHARRRMEGGGQVLFLANAGREDLRAMVSVTGGCQAAQWLDPWTGEVRRVRTDAGDVLSLRLPAYGSALLACGVRAGPATVDDPPEREVEATVAVGPWTLDVTADDVPGGTVHLSLDTLADWRGIEALRHSGGPGVYRAKVTLPAVGAGGRVVLALGRVDGVAEVRLNGGPAERLIAPPFEADVTAEAVAGDNDVEVTLVPPPRNRYVGKGLGGDPQYAQFTGSPEVLAHAGLIGPVEVRVERDL
jgi:hypothetical protein